MSLSVAGRTRARPPRIGYYVHHVGSGHRHRATALAERLTGRGVEVVGLSSGERPSTWAGDWVRLERDDEPPPAEEAGGAEGADVTAGGRLHWVPLGHRGLARRTARISAWLAAAEPDLVVSDVSQEVTLLARLHGVPVLSVLLPGRRDDPAHVLGLEVSSEVVAFWPEEAVGMSPGLPGSVARRLHRLGAMSRFAPLPEVDADHDSRRTARHGVVLVGSGGGAGELEAAARALGEARPDWTWRVLGGAAGWSPDPWAELCRAEVVVTHAGQNALAEVAAARVPALVLPQPRPHQEQVTTAAVLGAGHWPVVTVGPGAGGPGAVDWSGRLSEAAALDGRAWAGWVDGGAGDRFADLVQSVCRVSA